MNYPRPMTKQMYDDRDAYVVFISNLTGVPVDDILGRSRVECVCISRHLLAYALVQLCGYSSLAAGNLMHRNYATVLHGCYLIRDKNIIPFDGIQRMVDAITSFHNKRMEGVLV